MSDGIRFKVGVLGSKEVTEMFRFQPERFRRSSLSLVKQEARGLAVQLALASRPVGFTDKARKRGESGVVKDINKVFKLPRDAYDELRKSDPPAADSFWVNIQNRRFTRAAKALQGSTSKWNTMTVGRLDPAVHKHARTGYGNVAKSQQPLAIVTTTTALDTYVARMVKRVGFAKGAWIAAAKAIGGRVRGVPQWVSRHTKKEPATARVRVGQSPSVTLINNLDYADDVLSAGGLRYAMTVAQKRLNKAMAIMVQKAGESRSRGRRAG